MTTGGRGIPRLQELSYLEVVALAVSEGVTFEGIRVRMIDHMIAVGEASPGTGNVAAYRTAKQNPRRYVLNVAEGLKELMRLGLLQKATLPASASSAHAYKNTTFAVTDAGSDWIRLLREDRRAAYDHLCALLLDLHPQFGGFLRVIGAFPDSANSSMSIPMLRWGEVQNPRTRANYMSALSSHVAAALASEDIGWKASAEEIDEAVTGYVRSILERAEARERPDPLPRNQDLVNKCEEALVKLAFRKAGSPVDYISMEILRRWTRTLGLANFSYHAPGPYALRFWPTSQIMIDGQNVLDISRRVGAEWRNRIIKELRGAYELVRRSDRTGSVWVPVYRVRAAVCWRLQISDSEFDVAILEFLRGERGGDAEYGVNLDPASYGSIPPSERPLVIAAPSGVRVFKSMSLVPRTTSRTAERRNS